MTWWMPMPIPCRAHTTPPWPRPADFAKPAVPKPVRCSTSGFHDEDGPVRRTPSGHAVVQGRVWSMNSSPGIKERSRTGRRSGAQRHASNRYGPQNKADLDGEYIDSSEGYVTDELDFRRDHLAAAQLSIDVLAGSLQAGRVSADDRRRVRTADGQRRATLRAN